MKLKADVKSAWLTALRSGAYHQGTGCLKRTYKPDEVLPGEPAVRHCCLGVLCEVYKLSTGKGTWSPGATGAETFQPPYGGSATALPMIVADWAFEPDLSAVSTSTDPYVDMPAGKMNISSVNDQSYSFNFIADLIEDQL